MRGELSGHTLRRMGGLLLLSGLMEREKEDIRLRLMELLEMTHELKAMFKPLLTLVKPPPSPSV